MKIVITGSCGFIGSKVSARLLQEGHYVIGIDNCNSFIYSSSFKIGNKENLIQFQNYRHIDSDFQDTDTIIESRPDLVIHLAAHANVRKSFNDPLAYVQNNVVGTCKIIQDCLQCSSKPMLIYASSSSVYGTNTEIPFQENQELKNIISIYALSKKMCEEMVELYSKIANLRAIGLRFFTVYGPGGRPDMAIYNFLKKIEKGQEIILYGDGEMKRDFTFVEDIVDGICACVRLNLQPGEQRIYNLGNNTPITLNDLLQTCESIVGKKAYIVYKPIPIGEVPITYANIEKAIAELGFSPKTKLQEGLEKTYAWVKRQE